MRKTRSIWICVLQLVLSVATSHAKEVYVEVLNGDSGHGLLRYDGSRCYVILPKHIVSDPGTITVTGIKGQQAEAKLKTVDADADLALLVLGREDTSMCRGSSIPPPRDTVDNILQNATDASLRTITADGNQTALKIVIRRFSKQSIIFDVMGGEALSKGLSGSVVVVKGVVIGMMYGIAKGQGVAYRVDYIEEFWNRIQPPRALCESGCEVSLGRLLLVQDYANPVDNGNFAQTAYDSVFRLPEGWPVPPYFHVLRSKIQFTSEFGTVPPSISVIGFSFSSDQSDHASDFYIGGAGYDVTGQALGSFIYENRVWSISITGTKEPAQMSLRIKPVSQ